MNKKRFLICLVLGVLVFYLSSDIKAVIEHFPVGGLYKFFMSLLIIGSAFVLIFCALFSLVGSGAYLLARGDPELKQLVENMFKFLLITLL